METLESPTVGSSLSPIAELVKDLGAARAEFKPVVTTETANIQSAKGSFSYRYADLLGYLNATDEALHAHHLVVISWVGEDAAGNPALWAMLAHENGATLTFGPFPLALPQNVTMQEMGKAITYARRYMYAAILNIAAEDNDAADLPAASKSVERRQELQGGGWNDAGRTAMAKQFEQEKKVPLKKLPLGQPEPPPADDLWADAAEVDDNPFADPDGFVEADGWDSRWHDFNDFEAVRAWGQMYGVFKDDRHFENAWNKIYRENGGGTAGSVPKMLSKWRAYINRSQEKLAA